MNIVRGVRNLTGMPSVGYLQSFGGVEFVTIQAELQKRQVEGEFTKRDHNGAQRFPLLSHIFSFY